MFYANLISIMHTVKSRIEAPPDVSLPEYKPLLTNTNFLPNISTPNTNIRFSPYISLIENISGWI